MALTKAVDYKGVTATYWKILKVLQDVIAGTTSVQIGLYKDADARTADIKNVLNDATFKLPGAELTRAQIYTALKNLPAFAGATDV